MRIYFAGIAGGCNKLEEEGFEGRKTCRGFMEGRDATEYFKKLKKERYK